LKIRHIFESKLSTNHFDKFISKIIAFYLWSYRQCFGVRFISTRRRC